MKSSSKLLYALLALGITATSRQCAQAQNNMPPEMTAVIDNISDIDKMRVIGPMKFTAEQLERIEQAVRQTQTNYNAKLIETAVTPIRTIAADIKETRKKVVAGGEIPADFDATVKKISADYNKKREALDESTRKSLSSLIKSIITDEQKKTAIKLAKSLTKVGDLEMKGTEDEFFQFYVLGAFFSYPRAVPLLEDVRKAMTDGVATEPSPTPQGMVMSREAAALFNDIADIDEVRNLQPLNLTPDQMEKLAAIVKKYSDSYIPALLKAVEPLKSLASDVKEIRRKVIAGGEIPEDFDAKVKKLQSDFDAKRVYTDNMTLLGMATEMRSALTETQIAAGIKWMRDLPKRMHKQDMTGPDDKFFNFYVLNTFYLYPRADSLLLEMKQAKENAVASGGSDQVASIR